MTRKAAETLRFAILPSGPFRTALLLVFALCHTGFGSGLQTVLRTPIIRDRTSSEASLEIFDCHGGWLSHRSGAVRRGSIRSAPLTPTCYGYIASGC